MAVLHETQRFFNIVPLNGPRRVMRDTELDGYLLPKNTVILVSLFSVHMDPEIWTDPEEFRPERFITSDGKINDKLVDRLMSFGLGMHIYIYRTCITLFYILHLNAVIVSLFKRFQVAGDVWVKLLPEVAYSCSLPELCNDLM